MSVKETTLFTGQQQRGDDGSTPSPPLFALLSTPYPDAQEEEATPTKSSYNSSHNKGWRSQQPHDREEGVTSPVEAEMGAAVVLLNRSQLLLANPMSTFCDGERHHNSPQQQQQQQQSPEHHQQHHHGSERRTGRARVVQLSIEGSLAGEPLHRSLGEDFQTASSLHTPERSSSSICCVEPPQTRMDNAESFGNPPPTATATATATATSTASNARGAIRGHSEESCTTSPGHNTSFGYIATNSSSIAAGGGEGGQRPDSVVNSDELSPDDFREYLMRCVSELPDEARDDTPDTSSSFVLSNLSNLSSPEIAAATTPSTVPGLHGFTLGTPVLRSATRFQRVRQRITRQHSIATNSAIDGCSYNNNNGSFHMMNSAILQATPTMAAATANPLAQSDSSVTSGVWSFASPPRHNSNTISNSNNNVVFARPAVAVRDSGDAGHEVYDASSDNFCFSNERTDDVDCSLPHKNE